MSKILNVRKVNDKISNFFYYLTVIIINEWRIQKKRRSVMKIKLKIKIKSKSGYFVSDNSDVEVETKVIYQMPQSISLKKALPISIGFRDSKIINSSSNWQRIRNKILPFYSISAFHFLKYQRHKNNTPSLLARTPRIGFVLPNW